jgi:phospholipid/cholesterol/gamma-HCH transport system substrate-binding protein
VSHALSRKQALLLGLVVLAGLALGAWALFQIGGRQRLWAETFELRAGFNQANGIDRGTPVRFRGVNAGQVVGLELPGADQPDGKVYVRLRLDRKFQSLLTADSKARVLSEGMLGGRLINIEPGKDLSRRLGDGDELAVVEAKDLTDIMAQASQTLQEIRDSNGTLSKLLKSDEAHQEVVGLVKQTQQLVKQGQQTFAEGRDTLREGKEALAAVKQDAEAIKRLPLIRGYVEDANGLIYRPDRNGDRRVYASNNLFEPGRAILTDEGRMHLNNLGSWIEGGKLKGSEVVVVSYADSASPDLPPAAAQNLTLRQSEAVAEYLKEHLKAHRTGWFSSRNVTPLGMGHTPPPVPEREPLSPNRTEILVFTPK